MKNMKLMTSLFALLLLFSCGKEEFAANKQIQSTNTPSRVQKVTTTCSQSTLVRPPVDLLLLWDNSTSSNFINAGTKAALSKIITQVSDRFDYNIMMAPLVGSGNSQSYFISRSGHNPGSGITRLQGQTLDQTKQLAENAISQFTPARGPAETGAARATSLLASNQSNGVFRQNAYHLVVVMSNEDSTGYNPPNANFDQSYRKAGYIKAKAHDLLCIRGNYNGSHYTADRDGVYSSNCAGAPSLNSLMMRFITVAPLSSSRCRASSISQYKLNEIYKGVSRTVYSTPYTNSISSPTDQTSSPFDAVDICNEQYSNIFDGVNTAITDTVLKHVYKFWPIASSSTNIDPSTLVVTRNDGTIFSEISSHIVVNEDNNGKNDIDQFNQPVTGWRLLSGNNTVNTRFLPTDGEPYTGKLIQLFGQAKITFPACMQVSFKEPNEYFGYVHISSKPQVSTIVLKINGQVINQGATNGWTLIGSNNDPTFLSNFNTKIKSPTDTSPGTPGVFKTGYFVKVHGTSIFTNGDSVEISFLPQGN